MRGTGRLACMPQSSQIEICFQDMREGVGNCIELTFAARISTLQNSSSELVNLRSVL